jgi:predicted  nucleic acid-binding Zn-ribbon protein
MATPQPQSPPPQPIYPYDLNLALDRVHTKFVEYARGNDEALAAQMRIGFAESQMRDDALTAQMRAGFAEAYSRDDALLRRIENLEATVKTVIEIQRETIAAVQEVRQEVREMHQEMHTSFSALNEKVNELSTRVMKLEGGLPPTITES